MKDNSFYTGQEPPKTNWLKKILLWLGIAAAATTVTVGIIKTTEAPQVQINTHYIDSLANAKYGEHSQLVGCNGRLSFNLFSWDNDEFLKAVDSLGADMFRVPGGGEGNQWNWRTDIPKLTDVAKLVNHGSKKYKITFVLNMITDSLGSQLQMLDSAYHLKIFTDSTLYCEFSNETNTAARNDMLKKYGSVENFSAECAKWIAAVKQKYPLVHPAIPGGNQAGRQFKDWNAKILAKNPDVNLVWHYHNPRDYVSPAGVVDTATVSFLIDSVYKAAFVDFPINRVNITEFNLRNEDNDKDIFFKDDVQHGLACSFMMSKFYRMGFPIILFHNIVKAEDNGAVICTKQGSYLSATGIAIRNFLDSIKAKN